jgi:hypothetical protein
VPGPAARSGTDIVVPLTLARPALTCCPDGPVTVMLLKPGSNRCVNVNVTCRGADATELPTRG